MSHYTIELIPLRDEKPALGGTTDREERRFTNLGEALQRAREMNRWYDATAIGFRISNAAGELVHEWRPRSSAPGTLSLSLR